MYKWGMVIKSKSVTQYFKVGHSINLQKCQCLFISGMSVEKRIERTIMDRNNVLPVFVKMNYKQWFWKLRLINQEELQ